MTIKFYSYPKCGTCQKSKKHFINQGVKFEEMDITLFPPPLNELQLALKNGYSLKDLFNKSGEMYRNLNMKEKLPKLSEAEALDLLSKNGKLIKRPFVCSGQKTTVGYDPQRFEETWQS